MRRSLTVFLLLLATGLSALESKDALQELSARADAARPEDRPTLYVDIGGRQLKPADEYFRDNQDERATSAVKDVVTYSQKAHDAALVARSRMKNTEIALRKMASKLRDIKRTL